jgi:hypothetical protein
MFQLRLIRLYPHYSYCISVYYTVDTKWKDRYRYPATWAILCIDNSVHVASDVAGLGTIVFTSSQTMAQQLEALSKGNRDYTKKGSGIFHLGIYLSDPLIEMYLKF